ncbi:MAG: glycosyltransferase family 2 protein [Gemmatimonadota bacterium]|nr:glycosyltransferase family 2 protein [Gemmatimonadota bacterium]MDE2954353.1 glycosyltransferase family 2 protein [Gemmatimonadota bacterium]
MSADIGVVITTHNYGHYLAACLESVLSQTLLPRQVVVVDDASEDNAADVVASFSGVQYCRVNFRNGNRARNFGFLKVSTPYVAFFDADNVMRPRFLYVLYSALQEVPHATYAYGDRIVFADGDLQQGEREVSGPFDVRRLRAGNYIDLAALIRADRFPGFDPAVRRYQDWDLWLNIALKQGGIGQYVPEALYYYRVHAQSVSQREDRDRAMWRIRRKYHLGWGALPLLRHSFRLYQFARKTKSVWTG